MGAKRYRTKRCSLAARHGVSLLAAFASIGLYQIAANAQQIAIPFGRQASVSNQSPDAVFPNAFRAVSDTENPGYAQGSLQQPSPVLSFGYPNWSAPDRESNDNTQASFDAPLPGTSPLATQPGISPYGKPTAQVAAGRNAVPGVPINPVSMALAQPSSPANQTATVEKTPSNFFNIVTASQKPLPQASSPLMEALRAAPDPTPTPVVQGTVESGNQAKPSQPNFLNVVTPLQKPSPQSSSPLMDALRGKEGPALPVQRSAENGNQPKQFQSNFFNVVTPSQQPNAPESSPRMEVMREKEYSAPPSRGPIENGEVSKQAQSNLGFFNVVTRSPNQSKLDVTRPMNSDSQFPAKLNESMEKLPTPANKNSSPVQRTGLSDDEFFSAVTQRSGQSTPGTLHKTEPVRLQPLPNSSSPPANASVGGPRDIAPSPLNYFNVVTKPTSQSQQQQNNAASQLSFFNVVSKSPPNASGRSLATMPAVSNNPFKSVSYSLQEQQDENAGVGQSDADLANNETRLGTEPASNELVFLRRQTVLLGQGQSQFDVGFAYSHLDDDRPVALLNGGGNVVGVVEARTRSRLLVAPFEIRYGLTDRIQLFANTVVGWSNSEIAFNGFSQAQDIGGIGDSHAGMSMLLKTGQCDSPDVIFTLGTTAPTGNDSFISANLVPNAQLGQGFWSLFGNLLFVHTWDPIVVYYGVGYNHRFDHTFLGVSVNPGEEFNYQLGVGFAVNSNVTLSASFQGAYLSEIRTDGDLIEGSTLEPMRARLAVTVARNCRIWEPFAEIPMTDDAAARVGMTWTF